MVIQSAWLAAVHTHPAPVRTDALAVAPAGPNADAGIDTSNEQLGDWTCLACSLHAISEPATAMAHASGRTRVRMGATSSNRRQKRVPRGYAQRAVAC